MEIYEKDGDLVIEGASEFDAAKIFDCGQCFRFNKTEDGSYRGVAFGKVLRVAQDENCVTLRNASVKDYEEIWQNFFDMGTDYAEIKEKLKTDEVIIHAAEAGSGIRILRQELWECLISFIVSQNNNIPRIKKIIEALCANYGEKLVFDGQEFYSFPTPERLAAVDPSEFKALGAGYRDEYISLAARGVASGKVDLKSLSLLPTEEARKELLALKGIGGKVADCILLFGMHRTEVCPHDVWVKRIFSERYHIENINEKKGYALARSKWGDYAGIAQQYLFFAEREEK